MDVNEMEIRRREPKSGILKLDITKTRDASTGSVEFKESADYLGQVTSEALIPISPQPSVDRLSVTWAEPQSPADTKVAFLQSLELPSPEMEVRFPITPGVEASEDEDYSASVSAIMLRRGSTRRSRRSRLAARRPSSPFPQDIDPGTTRRRSSAYTTSSGDTAISMEEPGTQDVTQEQIYDNIRLHKEVLHSVKQQPLGMRRKLKLVHQAKAYIKRHEGALQERLAQSKSTRDIVARFNILLATKWQHMKREAANLSNLLIPWELRIKEIESHFGSVVASYFTFLRWLFWVNMIIAVMLITFVIVPEILTAAPDPDRKELLPEEKNVSINLLILWEFEGVLKYSPIFYGFYSNKDSSETGYRMPFAYFMTGLAVYVYSFVATLRKMAENSRMSKLSEKEDECIFSWKLFTGWDFMIGNTETAHNRTSSIILGFKEALLEEAEKKKDPRNWKIIALRVLVNTCVLILLGISAYAVVTVVKANTDDAEGWWEKNEITIVISLITFIFPYLFEILGLLEGYHPRKQLRVQLGRIMLLNLLNLYALIIALFNKIDGMTKQLEEMNQKPNMTSTNTNTPSMLKMLGEKYTTTIPSISSTIESRHEVEANCSADFSRVLIKKLVFIAATLLTTQAPASQTSTDVMTRSNDEKFEIPVLSIKNIYETPNVVSPFDQHMLTSNELSYVDDYNEDDSEFDYSDITNFKVDGDIDRRNDEAFTTHMPTTMLTNDYNSNIPTTYVYKSESTIPIQDTVTEKSTTHIDETVTTETTTSESSPTTNIASNMTIDSTISDSSSITKDYKDSTTTTDSNKSDASSTSKDYRASNMTTDSAISDSSFTTNDYMASNMTTDSTISDTSSTTKNCTASTMTIDSAIRDSSSITKDYKDSTITTDSNKSDASSTTNDYMASNMTTDSTISDTSSTTKNYTASNMTTDSAISDSPSTTNDYTASNMTTDSTISDFSSTTNDYTASNTTSDPTIGDSSSTNNEYAASSITTDSTTFSGTTDYTQSSMSSTEFTYPEPLLTERDFSINNEYNETSTYSYSVPTQSDLSTDGSTQLSNNVEISSKPDATTNTPCVVRKCGYPTERTTLSTTMRQTTTAATSTSKESLEQKLAREKDERKAMPLERKRKLRKLCWETMFGQEMVKLTMMDMVMTIITTLFMDFIRAVFARFMNRCWCWDLEKTFPQYGDFKIAENILHLVNNQGMVWMGMFFSPGLVLINIIKLIIMMYLRSWAVMTCNVPHEVVFRASRSNNFYLALLLTMLFLCVLPVSYAIVWVKPSWHCGPFAGYERMYYLMTSSLEKFLPVDLKFALDYVASPGIVIPLLVLLVLIIYYLLSLTNSLREANNDLKIQLRRERTEERRKMFQIADRRRRVGSNDLENTPFAKWKKILPMLPPSKSIDSTEKKANEESEGGKIAKKIKGDIFAKIVKMARKSNEVSAAVDKVTLTAPMADDETDTEFHETLPEDLLHRTDIRKKKQSAIESKDIGKPSRKEDGDFPPDSEDKGSSRKKESVVVKLEDEITPQKTKKTRRKYGRQETEGNKPESEPKNKYRSRKYHTEDHPGRDSTEKVHSVDDQKERQENDTSENILELKKKETVHQKDSFELKSSKLLKNKQTNDANIQSKLLDASSVIPVITISKMESDDETLDKTDIPETSLPSSVTSKQFDEEEVTMSTNSPATMRKSGSCVSLKTLKRQSSVDSIHDSRKSKERINK